MFKHMNLETLHYPNHGTPHLDLRDSYWSLFFLALFLYLSVCFLLAPSLTSFSCAFCLSILLSFSLDPQSLSALCLSHLSASLLPVSYAYWSFSLPLFP